MTSLSIVLSTIDPETAPQLASKLIQSKLAACVNILPTITSVYEWEGKVCQDSEVLLIIKTPKALSQELFDFLEKHHPYDVPEIVDIGCEKVLEPYLKWALEVTKT